MNKAPKEIHPLSGSFWEKSPYSRIVSWGRDLEAVRKYIVKNLFEAAGLWNAKDRTADLISLDCREGLRQSGVFRVSEEFEQGKGAYTIQKVVL